MAGSKKVTKKVAVIVAHPDDETLWAGGTILSHPSWNCFIVCLCRGNDNERAPRYRNALKILKSEGDHRATLMTVLTKNHWMKKRLKVQYWNLLPPKHFDLIITHNPTGEYTRHIRHEEVSKAVIKLWHAGRISTNMLGPLPMRTAIRNTYPKPVETASVYRVLSKRIWLRKYSIITETYGFEKNSFEAMTTPRAESFWQFADPYDAKKWLKQ